MHLRPLAFVVGIVAACNLVSSKGDPGEPCSKGDDCKTFCRPEGYCGQDDCKANGDCPSKWTCNTSSGDPIFGIGEGDRYCEPTCDACPKGTACQGSQRCSPTTPTVTLKGDVAPRVGQPAHLELAIDGHGRPTPYVAWTWGNGPAALPAPATGQGTKLTTTFAASGHYTLHVDVGESATKRSTVTVEVAACGEIGSTCHDSDECCGGGCVLQRYDQASREYENTCGARCPASCAAGYTCRSVPESPSVPAGDYCVSDPPVVTIDASPKEPHTDEEVTFTATVTSPAGLEIVSYDWREANGYTLDDHAVFTHTFSAAGVHHMTLDVSDEAGQVGHATFNVSTCIKAGGTCGFGSTPGGCCTGLSCTSFSCN